MNSACDAADRFFERYCPGPMDILGHCFRWILSDECEAILLVLLMWGALVVAVFQIDHLISVLGR